MATIKSFTSLQQSRRLAEILPLESADMYYINGDSGKISIGEWGNNVHDEDDLPCWSLASLLGVLPEGIIENYYAPNLQKENGKYTVAYGNNEFLCIADNPVDACVEMIVKLHELNLL